MADYWKSQPRKRCDFCDCWIAENKPSIDFHEKGKRHKENVEKKIAELRKQGQEQYKQQQALDGMLKKMEEDALKKFKQDVANDPALSAKYKALQAKAEADAKKTEPSKTDHAASASGSSTESSEQQNGPVWYEGTNPEGHVYYWNSVTQESLWEKPADFDGVSSHSDQQDTSNANTETKSEASTNDTEEEEEEETESKSPEEKSEEFADRRPEKRKANAAYGTWETVEHEHEEPVDLELPENSRTYAVYRPKAEQYEPREKLKFKEKTVASLSGKSSDDSSVGFKKKRKFGGNVRKRDTTA